MTQVENGQGGDPLNPGEKAMKAIWEFLVGHWVGILLAIFIWAAMQSSPQMKNLWVTYLVVMGSFVLFCAGILRLPLMKTIWSWIKEGFFSAFNISKKARGKAMKRLWGNVFIAVVLAVFFCLLTPH